MIPSRLIVLLLLALVAPPLGSQAMAGDDVQPRPTHLRILRIELPPAPSVAPLTWRSAISPQADAIHPAGRNWAQRHPALFGALVGAGGGALFAMVSETELFCSGGDEDCVFYGAKRPLVGAGLGAGVGALIGFSIGR